MVFIVLLLSAMLLAGVTGGLTKRRHVLGSESAGRCALTRDRKRGGRQSIPPLVVHPHVIPTCQYLVPGGLLVPLRRVGSALAVERRKGLEMS